MIYRICIAAPGFLLAICVHEYAHALAALRFGDPTAKNYGRLSVNPAVHYDLFGTIILPVVMAALGMGIFGYAKPVPIDTRYFKNMRKAVFWVSFAGPLSNILLMVVSALLLTILVTHVPQDFYLFDPFTQMLKSSVLINIVLAVFNLIPFPPLDGSRMLSSFLSYDQQRKYENLERFSFLFFIVLWQTNLLSYLMQPALSMGSGLINFFINVLS